MKKSYEVTSLGNSKSSADFHITLRLTEKCNIKCDYCLWCGGEHYIKWNETIDKVFEHLSASNTKCVLFYITGGEPALHPDIIEVINHIRGNGEKYEIDTVIEIQTNMSYSNKLFSDIAGVVDRLCISYHFNELKRCGLDKTFMNNFNYIVDNHISIERLDIMLEDIGEDNLSEFYNTVEWMISYGNIVDSEMIYGYYDCSDNEKTTKQHIEFYNTHNKTEQSVSVDGIRYTTNELFSNGLDCRGCRCMAGKRDFIVNGNGDIFLCAAHLTEYLNRGVKPITNIVTDGLSILSIRCRMKTTCTFMRCGDFYIERTV